jgi:hypothetical protein
MLRQHNNADVAPAPCCPSRPTRECERCVRHRPDLTMPADCRPRTIVIDASRLVTRDATCPMRGGAA